MTNSHRPGLTIKDIRAQFAKEDSEEAREGISHSEEMSEREFLLYGIELETKQYVLLLFLMRNSLFTSSVKNCHPSFDPGWHKMCGRPVG